MEERQIKRIIIPDSGYTVYYSEQEVAEYCQVEVHMLRRLHAVGLIEGVEMVGEERRYSEKDAERRSSPTIDRKSTRLNSSHDQISYAVFCLKKKNGTKATAAHGDRTMD